MLLWKHQIMMFPKETGLAHTLQNSAKTDTFHNHWASRPSEAWFLKEKSKI